MEQKVAQAYNREPVREWVRLERDAYHTVEFEVTMHHLRRHLPAGGKILDAGGGPGRYARELCRAGHDVVLLDLSSELIALAREKMALEPPVVQSGLLNADVGDIRDLSRFEAGEFDAALCLGGPLTHVDESAGRVMAVKELARVTRPGGLVALSVMGRLAVLRTILASFSDEILDGSLDRLVRQGDTSVSPTGTEWHFFRAGELRELAESCGLETVEMAGCEGLSSNLIEATNRGRRRDEMAALDGSGDRDVRRAGGGGRGGAHPLPGPRAISVNSIQFPIRRTVPIHSHREDILLPSQRPARATSRRAGCRSRDPSPS